MTSTDSKIASIITSRWRTLSGDYSDVMERNATYTDMYRSYLNFDESYPWDYTLVDPAIFQLLRTMMSRLNPDGARVNLLARNAKAAEFRERNQHAINWELSEMKKTLVFYRSILRGLIGGRSYLGTGWLFEPAVKIKSDIKGKEEFIMRDMVNRATARNIRFEDLLPGNRNIPDFEEQPFILERLALRYGEMLDDNKRTDGGNESDQIWKPDYLKKIGEKRMFIDKIEGGFDLPNDADDVRGIKTEDQYLRNQYVGIIKMSTKDGEVFHTLSEQEKWILDVSNANPYWHGHYPYLSFSPFPEDDEFYSQSMVQPLEDLEIALTSSLNQFMTNARKAANPMWIAGQTASQTPDWQFVNRPDGVIRVVGDAQQVRQVTTADTSNLMNNLSQNLNTLFEKSSSISALYSAGVSSTSQMNKTATGAKVIDANIDLNMQMLVSLFGAQILSGIGTHFLELNAQYITEEQEIRITGENNGGFIRLSPQEITANFDVVANPDTITKTSPVVRQASLLNLKSTMDSEKNVKLDTKPVWKAIFASYPEIEEIDEDIIIDPETQADMAIETIMRGLEPTVTYNQDHKVIRQIVQVFVMSNQDELSDDQIIAFSKYIDKLSVWIDAGKQVITMQQQEDQLENPNLPPDGLYQNPPMVTEQQIEQSAEQGANPTRNMPNNVPLTEQGLM